MNWISVKNKLPEQNESVLIFSKNGGVAEARYRETENVFIQYRWSVIKGNDVTHWMPLPEPPESAG